MLTEQQKAEREESIGSSDAPVIAAVSPYKSPLELFYQLSGQLPRYTDEETQAQRIGSKLEPMIAELAAEELGLKIRRSATRRHAAHPFMVANLDFEIVNNPKGPGVLEIKNRGASKPWEALPDDITIQAAHQLAVTNREWGIVAVLFGFGQLKTYEVRRDKELEECLIELEAHFMLKVQMREPPTEAWTPETVGLLKKLYPTSSGTTIALPDEYAINAEGFLAAKADLDAVEERKAVYEGALKAAIKDADTATVSGYAISWRSTKPSKAFDLERFKIEQPSLYEQYQTCKPGFRRFLVKAAKELRV